MRAPSSGRQRFCRAALAAASCLSGVPPRPAHGSGTGAATTLQLPLQATVGGVLTTGVFIDGTPFRLIVDSGSPYLVVPLDDCATQPPRLSSYGCAEPGQYGASGWPSTSEQYGAVPGRMQWLRGDVSFGETEARLEADGSTSLVLRFQQAGRVGGPLVFGGADRAVMSQSGGALLGLIGGVHPTGTIPAADLRPTALGQLRLASWRLDAPRRRLTLSAAPLLPAARDALPLVDPRPYGDGVQHVCCRVFRDELVLDGKPHRASRPVLCVFDSGLSGVVLSQSLVDDLGMGAAVPRVPPPSLADARAAPRGVRSLRLALLTERGARLELRSDAVRSPLFYTQAIPLNWFTDAQRGPHVVAVGQCVLGGGTLTVDAAQERALWEPG